MIFKYLEWIGLLHDMKRYQKVDEYDGTLRPDHLVKFYPKDAVSSDGSRYHGLFRAGRENKLLIVLDGGGFAFDEFSAARPSGDTFDENNITFYDSWCKPAKNAYARLGMFHEKLKKGPFYGWNLLYVPYANGDMHGGAGEFTYRDTEGKERTFYAHGNINLHLCIDFAKQFCPKPEKLTVLGCSAGGFGTAFVGNDILECFPDCKDCTCIVDGAALELDLRECAEKYWKVPESIGASLHTSDPVADGLEYLYAHQRGRVKIGYVISLRDYVLMMYQNFLDTKKEMGSSPEAAERMERIICGTVKRLAASIPDLSFFLYNYNFNDIKGRPVAYNGATSHCCLWVPEFMRFEREGCTGLQWVKNVVDGKTTQIGRELLK
ncbi:MAG: hypothetical protein K5796_08345 [Lachnospiraceae bacterium]|nr:hypothetical protein [Lachnospiraceae bacterium]